MEKMDPFCSMDSPLNQYSVVSTSEIHSLTLPGQMVAIGQSVVEVLPSYYR
jgi:hypothetical protein